MPTQSPDFTERELPIELRHLALIPAANFAQITTIAVLFDLCGSPVYDREDSDHKLQLGRQVRWFSDAALAFFLNRCSALFPSSSAPFTFSPASPSSFSVHPSSTAVLSVIDDVTPREKNATST